jgi:DNA-directed RNA polymerase subunit RPC12/RpoP
MTVPVYICPGCKTRIPFGTEKKRPPARCPGCDRRLHIPTHYDRLPWIDVTCPTCSERLLVERAWAGRRYQCPKCRSVVEVPPDPPPTP